MLGETRCCHPSVTGRAMSTPPHTPPHPCPGIKLWLFVRRLEGLRMCERECRRGGGVRRGRRAGGWPGCFRFCFVMMPA